ncbi:MAG: hypothetical protein ACKOSO_05700 [Actinomycetota bacterium]
MRETHLDPAQLILPLFVLPGAGRREPAPARRVMDEEALVDRLDALGEVAARDPPEGVRRRAPGGRQGGARPDGGGGRRPLDDPVDGVEGYASHLAASTAPYVIVARAPARRIATSDSR